MVVENPGHRVLRRLAALREQLALRQELSSAQLQELEKRKGGLENLLARSRERKELLIAEIAQHIQEIEREAAEEFRIYLRESFLQSSGGYSCFLPAGLSRRS